MDKTTIDKLDEKQKETLDQMFTRLGKRRTTLIMSRIMPGLFNKMCEKCRKKSWLLVSQKKGGEIFDNLCEDCENIIREKLKRWTK